MKRIIYLAGPIEIQGDTWRGRASEALAKLGFDTLDPLRGEELRKVGKHIESNLSPKAIVQRDKNDLRRTEISGGIVLANLNTTKDGRNPIGTLFELEWCTNHGVPVVAVMGRDCDPNYRTHPWICESVMYQATSVTDALNFIEVYVA